MCDVCVITVEETVENGMADRKFAKTLSAIRHKMNDGGFDPGYIDLFVCSKWKDRRYSLADAWAFGQLSSMLWMGELVVCQVGFRLPGATPRLDSNESENNRLLSQLIKPFSGWFRGGVSQDPGDGMIEWKDPVIMERIVDQGGGTIHRPGIVDRSVVEVPAGKILLEVGNVFRYYMYHRLKHETGVARWPYGSDLVTLLLKYDYVSLLRGEGDGLGTFLTVDGQCRDGRAKRRVVTWRQGHEDDDVSNLDPQPEIQGTFW